MRILFVHPNYRSGGAEIAGTWPPAWVAYLTGPLKRAGFDNITFIDAMTEGLSGDELRHLPARAAAPLLMAATRKHAWTFVGAGAFMPSDAWHFSIDRTPARDSLPPPESLFVWYAAVFTRLYRVLVAPDCTCSMIEPGFEIVPRRDYRIMCA